MRSSHHVVVCTLLRFVNHCSLQSLFRQTDFISLGSRHGQVIELPASARDVISMVTRRRAVGESIKACVVGRACGGISAVAETHYGGGGIVRQPASDTGGERQHLPPPAAAATTTVLRLRSTDRRNCLHPENPARSSKYLQLLYHRSCRRHCNPSVCPMPLAEKRCILGLVGNPMLIGDPTGQRGCTEIGSVQNGRASLRPIGAQPFLIAVGVVTFMLAAA